MSGFPFVYLNHGPLDPESFDKVDAAWIGFAQPLSDDVLAALVDACPAPLHGFFHADDAIFYCETGGDYYEFMVREEYGADGDGVSAGGAAAFSADVEAWVRAVHAQVPIAIVIGPGRPIEDGSAAMDAWARWSEQQIVPVVIPWLERYATVPFIRINGIPDAVGLVEIISMPREATLPDLSTVVAGEVIWHAEHNHQVRLRLLDRPTAEN